MAIVDGRIHHITALTEDSGGHWGWYCLAAECREEADGYEPAEIIEAASKHGPVAVDSDRPEPCTHCNGSGVDPEEGDECAHCEGTTVEPD